MATLFERVMGKNLPTVPAPDEERISFEVFLSGLFMVNEGLRTGAELISDFNLSASQQADAQAFLNIFNTKENGESKRQFEARFKSFGYFSENNISPFFDDQANLISWLNDA